MFNLLFLYLYTLKIVFKTYKNVKTTKDTIISSAREKGNNPVITLKMLAIILKINDE